MYVSSNQKDLDKYLKQPFLPTASRHLTRQVNRRYMLYGREKRLPIDASLLPPRETSPSIAEHRARVVEHFETAYRIAKENIQCAQQHMKDYHD